MRRKVDAPNKSKILNTRSQIQQQERKRLQNFIYSYSHIMHQLKILHLITITVIVRCRKRAIGMPEI